MVFEPLPIRVMLVSSVYITVLLWSLEVCVNESIVLLKIRYNIFCKIYINKHTSSTLKKNAEITVMSCTSRWQWCATYNFLSYWHVHVKHDYKLNHILVRYFDEVPATFNAQNTVCFRLGDLVSSKNKTTFHCYLYPSTLVYISCILCNVRQFMMIPGVVTYMSTCVSLS